MGAPTNLINKFAGATTTSTAAAGTTICTHSSALKNPDGSSGNGGILDRLILYNPDSITHTVNLHRVGAGLSVGSSNLIDSILVPTLTPYLFEGPLYGSSGDFYAFRILEALASTGTPICVQAYYHEMS